jgi:hypothetical protein
VKNQALIGFELCFDREWPLVNLVLVAFVMDSIAFTVVFGKLNGAEQALQQGNERSNFALTALAQMAA